MFRFDDIDYEVKEAILDAYIIEEGPTLVWGFELTGERKRLDEAYSGPDYIRVSILDCPSFVSQYGTIKKWQDIVGTRVELQNHYEKEPEILVYLGEHVELVDGYFEIFRDPIGKIRIKLIGLCDSFHGLSMKVEVDVPIGFKGILSGRKDKQAALSSLSRILDPNDFIFSQDANGVSICAPKDF